MDGQSGVSIDTSRMDEDVCEGCGVRDTGENFAHEGLCKKCMGTIMDTGVDTLMAGGDVLTETLAKSAEEKTGPLTDWTDDAEEVEVRLPLPTGTIKAQLTVKIAPTRLLVTGEDERVLLELDPLLDKVQPDGCNWSFDKGGFCILTLEKAYATRWGSTLCAEGGTFVFWGSKL